MAIEFVECSIDDVEAIYQLEKQLFPDPWNKDMLEFELSLNPLSYYVKLEDEGQLIGYGGVQVILDEGHIMNLAIDKKFQRQGYGKVIMRQLLNYLKEQQVSTVLLEVATKNKPAIRLYKSLGFQLGRIRKHYYENDDGYEMILHLG